MSDTLTAARLQYLADWERTDEALKRCADAAYRYAQAVKAHDHVVDDLVTFPITLAGFGPVHTSKHAPVQDEHAPRKPTTAYKLFKATVKDEMAKGKIDLGSRNLALQVQASWNALSEADRHPFEAVAQKQRDEYERQVELYEAGTVSEIRTSEVDLSRVRQQGYAAIKAVSQKIVENQPTAIGQVAATAALTSSEESSSEEDSDEDSSSADSFEAQSLRPKGTTKKGRSRSDDEDE